MNVRAIRRAVKRAEDAVEAMSVLDMGLFVGEVKRNGGLVLDGIDPDTGDPVDRGEICGTACCLAGYALNKRELSKALRGDDAKFNFDIAGVAAKKFEIEAGQPCGFTPDGTAWKLFNIGNWPCEFREAYQDADREARGFTPCTKRRLKYERKKIAILRDRVEHFITTEGRE